VSIRELSTPEADRNHPCTVDDFVVHQIKGSVTLTVPAGATAGLESLRVPRRQWPQIGMRNRPVSQDGCRGAQLTLGYTAFGSLGS
jgi:hypothetical protein